MRDRALLGILPTVAILAGVVVGIVNVRSMGENVRQVGDSHEVISGARDLLSVVKDAETGQRGYLLTADESYLEPYENALQRFDTSLARLDSLTARNHDQHARFIALRAAAEAKIAEVKRTVALLKSGDRTAALAAMRAGSGKALMDDVRENVAAIRETEEKLLQQHDVDMRQSVSTAIGSLALTALTGLRARLGCVL
jgi:CHASE3 domain sensor protein